MATNETSLEELAELLTATWQQDQERAPRPQSWRAPRRRGWRGL